MDAFPETVPELFDARAKEAPSRAWLFHESDSWTLADVADEIDRCAAALAERGVAKGDRVALLSENRPEALFVWLAANRLGAVFAAFNPALTPREIGGLLALTGPRVVVVAGEHRALAEASALALDEGARPLVASPEELARAGRGGPRADVSPDDVAVLIATSGTTGAPKAVEQTHRAYARTAEAFPWWLGLGESDRLLAALPLFHVNAQAYSTMGALGAGATLALLRKFSASAFWDDARRLGATEVNAVGAMVHILAKTPPRPSDRDHRVRLVYTALALPEEQHRAFERRFGVTMVVGYGMSETTFGTIWPRGEPPRYGTMGKLRQHPRTGPETRARVVKDDGTDAAPGEAGELWLAGTRMRGYFGDAAATAAALEGEWLKTGDLVRRDEGGWLTFVARKKEVLRRRGENVAAAEIEEVLLAHPAVGEAAAVGVPSELGEDEIVAYVAPREGATVDVGELLGWARARLAPFKVPSAIHVRDRLPRTPTARVAKHLLR